MNNNTPAKQKHYGLPQTSQNTKYVIYIISLLFLFTAGYSGYIIYQNKHNHDGSRFSLINLLTGKGPTPSSLKNSDSAKQVVKQIAQYNAPSVTTSQADIDKNAQKLTIINFYTDYLNNKLTGQKQDLTLAKYGTSNLVSEYKNGPTGKDVVTCAADLGASPIITPVQEDDSTSPVYSVTFQDDQKKQVSYARLNLITQNNSYLVDSVTCP